MPRISLALLAAVTAVLGTQMARGSTIDTFSVTETGWDDYSIATGVGQPNPNGLLTASFTGSVEADGFIEQSDLTAFTLLSNSVGEPQTILLSGVSLFSYDVTSGATSFDFAGSSTRGNEVCLGAAVGLDSACNVNFQAAYPPGTTAVAEFGGGPASISMSTPVVTPVSTVVPEPGLMGLTGIALIVFTAAGWDTRRRRLCLDGRSGSPSQSE